MKQDVKDSGGPATGVLKNKNNNVRYNEGRSLLYRETDPFLLPLGFIQNSVPSIKYPLNTFTAHIVSKIIFFFY